MRTTLTLDADVAAKIRQETAHGKKSLKEVVNERLRLGYGLKQEKPRKPFVIRTFSSAFAPGVDPTRLNQLVDELEVEAFLEKTRRLHEQ